MNRNEELLLLQLILEDIRGNWGDQLNRRVNKALELATKLELPQFIKSINYYKGQCKYGERDGRFFREHQEYGGYIDMKDLHGLDNTIRDKSDSFKAAVIDILTFPENRLKDWEEQ